MGCIEVKAVDALNIVQSVCHFGQMREGWNLLAWI